MSNDTSSSPFTSLYPDEENTSLYALTDDPSCAHHIEVIEESSLARVIKYVLKPGEKTGWHHHDLGFLTIQLSEGTLTNYIAKDHSETASAVGRETHFKPGTAVSHKAPLLHNAVNTGDTDVIAYEVEFLHVPATARMSDFDH
jgi:quercetin dioxygenase-like cupin family protein|tara:strand:- start:944 stop:1372 length:429 start_codon:yes stop_codon:yes gene_type:complete